MTASIRVPHEKVTKWLHMELTAKNAGHEKGLYYPIPVIADSIGVPADSLETAARMSPLFDVAMASKCKVNNEEMGKTFEEIPRKGKLKGIWAGIRLLDEGEAASREEKAKLEGMACSALVDVLSVMTGSSVSVTPTAYGFSVAFDGNEPASLASTADACEAFAGELTASGILDIAEEPVPEPPAAA